MSSSRRHLTTRIADLTKSRSTTSTTERFNLRRITRKLILLTKSQHTILFFPITTLFLLLIYFIFRNHFSARPPNPSWLLCVSKTEITPTERVWLSGFFSRNRTADAAALLDPSLPLYARGISLRRKGRDTDLPFVVIALDVIGLHRDVSNAIFANVKEKWGLKREQVRLVASHTHSGPVVGRNLEPLVPNDVGEWGKVERYAEVLKNKVVDLIGEVIQNGVVEVTPAFGRGSIGLAVNRLQVKEQEFDGWERGETDDEVNVFWFRGRRGETVAGMYGYSAHATVLTEEYLYSGDYPGVASGALEEKLGGTWLFAAGCGGDQNVYPRGTQKLVRKHGEALAKVVGEVVLRGGMEFEEFSGSTSFGFAHEEVPLKFEKRLGKRELRELRKYPNQFGRRAGASLIQQLGLEESTAETYPFPISVANIGGVRIAFLGGEPTIRFCRSLRERGADLVVGYTDDVMGYVATDKIMSGNDRHKFERAALYYGLPSVWKTGAEHAIIEKAENLLQIVGTKQY